MNDLMNKIQNNLSTFSKGQRLIAKYIIEHYDKAAFLTASKLGSTVGVSESTVVRFATELLCRVSAAAKGAAGDDSKQADGRTAYGSDQ